LQNPAVIIIGAGPAGLSCALMLAKKEISCLLLEKAVFPRDKVCGDALSGKTMHALRLLNKNWPAELENHAQALDSWGVSFYAPDRNNIRIPFYLEKSKKQTPPGFICKRMDFDAWLAQKATVQKWIDFKKNAFVSACRYKDNVWQVEVNGHEQFQSPIIVIASGAQSKIANTVSDFKIKPSALCVGVRSYFKGVQNMDKENFIELHFIKSLSPGYLWIFPLPDGEANVGIGMRSDVVRKKKINLRIELSRLIKHDPVLNSRFENAQQLSPVQGFGLPLGANKRKLSGEAYLLTGDAASLIDPFTGEGIGNAMLSGIIAAKHCCHAIEAKNYSASFLYQYDKEIYKNLWSELKLSLKLQYLSRHARLFNFVIRQIKKSKKLQHIITLMFEDIKLRKQLSKPFFYIKLLFFPHH